MGSTLMMSDEARQEPVPKEVHWVWDDAPDESLCGKNMTGRAWLDDSVPIDCKYCIEVADLIDELEGADFNG